MLILRILIVTISLIICKEVNSQPDVGKTVGKQDPSKVADKDKLVGKDIPTDTNKLGEKCIKPELVEGVDDDWVDKFGSSGLYNTLSYTFTDWRSTVSAPNAPSTDKKAKNKRCWKVFMKTLVGPFEQFTTTCTYYNDVAKESCNLDTSGTSLAGIFKHYGTFNIVMTDQDTYMVVYACLLGSRNYFLTLTKTAVIDPELKTQVEDYVVKKLGLRKENFNYNSTGEISIQKIELTECKEDDGMDDGWPFGKKSGGGSGFPSWGSNFFSQPFGQLSFNNKNNRG